MSDDRHRIFVCMTCQQKGATEKPGKALIESLADAFAEAEPHLRKQFEISGIECMAGCSRPCTVAYSAPGKATYLFGDIDPDTDLEDLIAFAGQFSRLEDGWCSSTERPGKLRKTTLARVPSAFANASATDRSEP